MSYNCSKFVNENENKDTDLEYYEDEEIIGLPDYPVKNKSNESKFFNLAKYENFPTIFFIIMVLILSSMLIRHTPVFKSYILDKEIYKNKFDIEYFSASFKHLNNFFTVKEKK